MDDYDYLCEELLDRVRRQDIPVYRALLDLSEMRGSIIPSNKATECRRELQAILEARVDKATRGDVAS